MTEAFREYIERLYQQFAKRGKQATRIQFFHTLNDCKKPNPFGIHLTHLHTYLGLVEMTYNGSAFLYTITFKGLWILYRVERHMKLPKEIQDYIYE